jgi:hypothetical protein
MRNIRYLIIIVFLFLCNFSYSNPVDSTLAKKVAKNYFEFLNPSRSELEIKNTITIYYNGYPSYYIINFIDGGYIAVSANDATVPILMYSYGGEYNENDFHNPAYLEWMENYSKEIDSVRIYNIPNDSTIHEWNNILNKNFSQYKSTKSVQPLITTKWGQTRTNDWYYPGYNSLCPSTSNSDCTSGHCAAGCVAIAMAQVMKYWMHPVHSTYQDYDWCNMPDELLYNSGNNQNFDIQQNAIAKLVHDCGVKANMSYCISLGGGCESFAWPTNAKKALVDDFGYSNDADLDRRQFYSKKKWIEKLKSELDNVRPLIYFALSTGKESFGSGHAFIIDGYNTDSKFHINWGWYGDPDEWYEIGNLTPRNYNFNFMQRAIFNLHPAWYVDCNSDLVLNNCEIISIFPTTYDNFFISASEGIVSTGIAYGIIGNQRIKFNDIGAGTIISYNTTIPNNVDINFKAYNQIILEDGFTAENGSNFTAEIIPCPAECPDNSKTMMISSNNYNEEIESKYDTIYNNDTKKEIDEFEFQVYPNPNNGIFNIVVQTTNKTDLIIELMNIQGQIIYRNNVKGVYIYKDQVNVSDFAKGIYFLRINTVDKVEIRKIVIQ